MKTKREVMKALATVRRRFATIQKKTDGFDQWGNNVEIWENWKRVMVEQSTLWGAELYQAAAVGQENTAVFIFQWVEFMDDINTVEYRISMGDRIFDIKHIDLLEDDNTRRKIRAIERLDQKGIELLDHPLILALIDLIPEELADDLEEVLEPYQ